MVSTDKVLLWEAKEIQSHAMHLLNWAVVSLAGALVLRRQKCSRPLYPMACHMKLVGQRHSRVCFPPFSMVPYEATPTYLCRPCHRGSVFLALGTHSLFIGDMFEYGVHQHLFISSISLLQPCHLIPQDSSPFWPIFQPRCNGIQVTSELHWCAVFPISISRRAVRL